MSFVAMNETAPRDPLMVDYLNAPDVAALALTDDEILAAVEAGLAAQGRGETVIEPRDAPRARRRRSTATSTCCAGTSRRSRSPASRWSATSSTTGARACPRRWAFSICSIRAPDARSRSSTRRASPTCARAPSPRSARRHLARKAQPRARSHRRTRHVVLERAPARSPLPLRRDPRALAPAGEPRRVRRAARARPRQAGRRNRRLGVVRARRRHRRRGVAARRAGADAADRMDHAAARFVVPYGTMSAVELSLTDIMDKIVVDDWGQCKGGAVRQPARARRCRQALRGDAARRAGRDRRRTKSRHASATTRRSCCGTADCRRRTSRSARRCSPRRSASASARLRCAYRCQRSSQCAHVLGRRGDGRGVANAAEWVVATAGVDVEVIDYPAPQPLSALWARPISRARSCAAIRSTPDRSAPGDPRGPRAESRRVRRGARVLDRIVVARDGRAVRTLEDTFGVAGWHSRRPIRNRVITRRACCSLRTRSDAAPAVLGNRRPALHAAPRG